MLLTASSPEAGAVFDCDGASVSLESPVSVAAELPVAEQGRSCFLYLILCDLYQLRSTCKLI